MKNNPSYKVGIVVFPGSNCDRDCYDAVRLYMEEKAVYLWHEETNLQGVDAVILPGGFSYGDYLRSGAIARFSPIMSAVRAFASQGRPVLGICNGFQVLTEAGLLPGSLIRNRTLQFICDRVALRIENSQTPFTTKFRMGDCIQLPIAHADGCFYAPPDAVRQLEENGQVVLRYLEDINGSINQIAAVRNERGNVLGMMPHPERNLWKGELWTGEGAPFFDALSQFLHGHTLETAGPP